MKTTVLKFGLLSGVTSAVLMWATVPFLDAIGFDNGVYVGYTGILLAFLFVYFGMRSYRDNRLGGTMSFATGFNAGILITLISCLFYVASWLILYYFVMPDFAAKYGAYLVEGLRAKGAAQAEIDAMIQANLQFRELLQNPLLNAAVSFTEPFPVGLLVTLVSAAVLRKAPEAPKAPQAP